MHRFTFRVLLYVALGLTVTGSSVATAMGGTARGLSHPIGRIAGTSFAGLFVMNGDGSDQRWLIRGDNAYGSPAWSPEGDRIAFSRRDQIWTMNVDGSGREQVTFPHSPQEQDRDIAWSPDGSKLVFTRLNQQGGTFDEDIFVVNVDGTKLSNLTNSTDFFEQNPSWSPDGAKIVFARGSHAYADFVLYVMDPDGSNLSLLGCVGRCLVPDWSPDGSSIAYLSWGGGETPGQIMVMDADGSNSQVIVEGDWLYDPTWSPDSLRIAFSQARPGFMFPREIVSVNADGTGRTVLTHRESSLQPDWGPSA